jgi:hypothetical protein
MKKILTLLLLALFPLAMQLTAQAVIQVSPQPSLRVTETPMLPNNGLPREINDYKWDAGSWKPHRHIDLKYTPEGAVEEETVEFSDGTSFRYTYSHDDAHDYTLEEEKVNGQWVPSARWTFGYDSYGYEVEYIDEAYQNGKWVVVDEWSWQYEYVGRLVASMILKKYDQASKTMVNDYKMLYTYNSQGLVDFDIMQDYLKNAFVNQSKTAYTYTKEGRINTSERFMWSNNAWAQNSMGTYTYSGQLSYTCLWGMWNSAQKKYMPYFREIHNYDDMGNVILYQNDFDPNGSGTWSTLYGMKYFNTYDGTKLIETIMQEWKTGGPLVKTTGWVNSIKSVYSNFLNLGIEDPGALIRPILVFPNPVSGTSITLDGLSPARPCNIEVYSSQGTLVKNSRIPAGNSRVLLDLYDLASGNYIIIVRDNSGIIAREKIIRE